MLKSRVVDGTSFWDPLHPDLDTLFVTAERVAPAATICVDAAARHRLPGPQRSAFAKAVNSRRIVCPPAGTIGGTNAFLRHLAQIPGVEVVCSKARAATIGVGALAAV